ncbi:5'-nucleotidase isoform X2 [Eurytemora carolleeae]|nr:5'-nucleotidase isoform X2 [Eurytemora carolleeae]|eukprot:XP_023333826.1 5'-nucleotidase-like isoform X2 [Eurytemora affinis]
MKILVFQQIYSLIILGAEGVTLTLLHVNDIHSHFEEVNVNTGRCRGTEVDGCYGGMSRMMTFIREVRTSDPDTILLNAGDYYQGTIWYTLFKYKPVVQFSNLLNYTAMALGNHDWDDGLAGLQPFVNQVNFPVLASNIVSEDLKGVSNSTVVQVDGVKVGIIGYTLLGTPNMSNSDENVFFFDEIESVRAEARRLKDRGVNIIIATGHSGYTLDKKMASEVEELDLVVGGHSHTFLYTGHPPSTDKPEGPYPTYIEQENGRVVPVVQAYAYTKYIGLLTLKFDEYGELEYPLGFAAPILLDQSIKKDTWVEEQLKPWKIYLKPYTTPISYISNPLYREKNEESSMGNLVADSMAAAWPGANIALINDGGIRTGVEKGYVTGEDVYNVLPFNNTVDRIQLSGAQLKDVLEDAVIDFCPDQTCEPEHFYQVSGLKIF